jgi:hypothetical protein
VFMATARRVMPKGSMMVPKMRGKKVWRGQMLQANIDAYAPTVMILRISYWDIKYGNEIKNESGKSVGA